MRALIVLIQSGLRAAIEAA